MLQLKPAFGGGASLQFLQLYSVIGVGRLSRLLPEESLAGAVPHAVGETFSVGVGGQATQMRPEVLLSIFKGGEIHLEAPPEHFFHRRLPVL
jgi:hypothetical protein